MRKLYATKLLNRPEMKFYLVFDYTLLSRWPKSTQAEIQSDGGSLGLVITLKNRSRLSHYWDTCGSPVIKCLCFYVVFFFSSATKWKDCAIVPSGHWALNTMTTNCDPMKCSHADHACYLDDDWRCHARTGPGHMTNHGIFAYKTLLSVVLYFNVFGLRSPGASRRKRSKYLQTHTQVVLFAANPR